MAVNKHQSMQKGVYYIFISFALFSSCSKDDHNANFSTEVRFDISGRMLEGKHIDCMDFDNMGNIWIASDKEIFYKNRFEQKTYTVTFPILDISIASDETLWIGSNGGGLGHLTSKGVTWYNNMNSGLPRDYVRNVEASPDGKVWFSSCAFRIGGLGVYDKGKFDFYTPENSPLNQNIVDDIEINKDGLVYISTSGTVGKTNIYRISENTWDCLGDESGMFYWVSSFSLSAEGTIYLFEDFSLSSTFQTTNNLFQFSDDHWNKIDAPFNLRNSLFAPLKADNRNYCWVAGYNENSPTLHVFDGKSWINSPEGIFPDDYITTIGVDIENNMWIGTSNNGVFILNQ